MELSMQGVYQGVPEISPWAGREGDRMNRGRSWTGMQATDSWPTTWGALELSQVGLRCQDLDCTQLLITLRQCINMSLDVSLPSRVHDPDRGDSCTSDSNTSATGKAALHWQEICWLITEPSAASDQHQLFTFCYNTLNVPFHFS